MGRIVARFFTTLDGVVEAPDQWHGPYVDDAMDEVVASGIARSRGVLMGLQLYRDWSTSFPTSDDEFASFVNAAPKYVVAHENFQATWPNTTVLAGHDVAAQVAEIKARTDGDLTMTGSATTARWLLAQGLVDELQLLVHPVAVGRGKRLFDGTTKRPLRLVRHEVFPSGVVFLSYAPLAVATRSLAAPAA